MAARSINIMYRCEECTFADAYGRGCKFGLMFPVLVFISHKDCENFEVKTNGQIEEQLRLMHEK